MYPTFNDGLVLLNCYKIKLLLEQGFYFTIKGKYNTSGRKILEHSNSMFDNFRFFCVSPFGIMYSISYLDRWYNTYNSDVILPPLFDTGHDV